MAANRRLHNLEIRGISRASLENVTLDLKKNPNPYLTSVKKVNEQYEEIPTTTRGAIHTFRSSALFDSEKTLSMTRTNSPMKEFAAFQKPVEDDNLSTPSIAASASFVVPRNDYVENREMWMKETLTDWTSGVTSSDWGDDVCEFDRLESNRVQIMLDQLNCLLFECAFSKIERIPPPTNQLKAECSEWRERFPHLRLLGVQIVEPQDLGHSFYPMEKSFRHSANLSSSSTSPSSKHLIVIGSPISIVTCASISTEAELAYYHEEIIFKDGLVEDMIAIDHRQAEEDLHNALVRRRNRFHQRHHGFPPVTPNAALVDTLNSNLFDHLWINVVLWLRPLIRESCHQFATAAYTLPENLPVEPPGAAIARLQNTSSIQRTVHSNQDQGLNDLLHISTKALQLRSLHDIPESPSIYKTGNEMRYIPLSTAFPPGRPLSGRADSARRLRAHPVINEHESVLTESVFLIPTIAAVSTTHPSHAFTLRGRSINPALERSFISSGIFPRSGTLPPVGSGSLLLSGGGSSTVHFSERSASRQSISILQFERPITTSGFQRSSTALNMTQPTTNSLLGNDSASTLNLKASVQRTRWGTYTPHSMNNPYRRGRYISSIVR